MHLTELKAKKIGASFDPFGNKLHGSGPPKQYYSIAWLEKAPEGFG